MNETAPLRWVRISVVLIGTGLVSFRYHPFRGAAMRKLDSSRALKCVVALTTSLILFGCDAADTEFGGLATVANSAPCGNVTIDESGNNPVVSWDDVSPTTARQINRYVKFVGWTNAGQHTSPFTDNAVASSGSTLITYDVVPCAGPDPVMYGSYAA